ncbi:MAG TPA: GFA family protein [Phenylobacterium sp.]|uniref:GFA family protein n=1 Tax=Phenylobacterium sp. TaxID=1871053 RepID=UPI002B4944E8|nr:GFA family protein [Phenylobacterium sp.]HKR88476.1 GFA family protein [Phenylobacterium sp.]HKT53603.1 GFA family protein [Caulobacteraceae bacterium]
MKGDMKDVQVREGGCACGEVRFRIGAPILGMAVCYCRECQRASGGGPNYVVLAPREAFAVIKGEARVHHVTAASGNDIGRAFCGTCGSPLWSATTDGTPFLPVKAGALDDPSDLVPTSAVFTCEAQPWHLQHAGVRSFEKMPPRR